MLRGNNLGRMRKGCYIAGGGRSEWGVVAGDCNEDTCGDKQRE